jgi:hypothetical protein
VPRVASLATVTVVPNAIFAGGEKAIIAVARAFGSRIVPAGGSSTIENACDGIIVTEVMVSGALPVFAMTNFFSRATTLPKSIVAGVTASRLNRAFGLASGEICCADARGAGATARKTQAQSAAMYRRIIAPQRTPGNDDAANVDEHSRRAQVADRDNGIRQNVCNYAKVLSDGRFTVAATMLRPGVSASGRRNVPE